MRDLYFVLKMGVVTFVIVILMQIKVGGFTLEERATNWIYTAPPIGYLQEAADGGLSMFRDLYRSVFSNVKTRFKESLARENSPGKRVIMKIKRSSQALMEDAAEKVEEKAPVVKQKIRQTARSVSERIQERGRAAIQDAATQEDLIEPEELTQ